MGRARRLRGTSVWLARHTAHACFQTQLFRCAKAGRASCARRGERVGRRPRRRCWVSTPPARSGVPTTNRQPPVAVALAEGKLAYLEREGSPRTGWLQAPGLRAVDPRREMPQRALGNDATAEPNVRAHSRDETPSVSLASGPRILGAITRRSPFRQNASA